MAFNADGSAQDVAAAGGWKDFGTLQEGCRAPDHASILAVMNEPGKRREIQTAV